MHPKNGYLKVIREKYFRARTRKEKTLLLDEYSVLQAYLELSWGSICKATQRDIRPCTTVIIYPATDYSASTNYAILVCFFVSSHPCSKNQQHRQMFEQSAILLDTWSQCSFNIIKFMSNVILRQGYLSLKEINPNPIISLTSSVKFEGSLRLYPDISNDQTYSIAQSKGHTPFLIFRYLSPTNLAFGDFDFSASVLS